VTGTSCYHPGTPPGSSQPLTRPKEDAMKGMRRIFLILSLLLPVTLLVSSASLAETKLEATIFSYDGQDF
jgi:hypothetical protein